MVEIKGVGDDSVEITGDVVAEFSPTNVREGMTLAFSDGTILDIHTDANRLWKIRRECIGRCAYSNVYVATHGAAWRSDIVRLTGDVEWVLAAERAHVVYKEGTQT